MDGRTDDTPIYVGLKGQVYDVSLRRDLYAPGKTYHCFVGKDASIQYGTGCASNSCVGSIDNPDAQLLIEEWLEFYHNHDIYKYIGRLATDPVDEAVSRAIEESVITPVTPVEEEDDTKDLHPFVLPTEEL